MSFLWKLLRIFRICMRLRSRKSPLHSDFQSASTYSYKDIKRKAFLQSYMKFGHKLRHNEFVQSRVLILEPWIKDFAMLFFIYISKNSPYCFVIERHSLIGHIIRKG